MPIQNYGIYWALSSNMLSGQNSGMWGKRTGVDPVDFASQIGIYVLEKNYKPVYVGRTGAGPTAGILSRLNRHHYIDKKRGKWDTSSWYGFRPVTKGGSLFATPKVRMETGSVISDIEALLIGVPGGDQIDAGRGKKGYIGHR